MFSDIYLCGLQSILCIDKSLLNHPGEGMVSRNTPTVHSADLPSIIKEKRCKARGLNII